MLSYKHSYHAGNFADLHKHLSLIIALQAMQRKEKPFVYIDTHAGSGLYHLKGKQAQKNREFKSGVSPVYQRVKELSQVAGVVQHYVDTIAEYNENGLGYYPGSPLIAKSLLRDQDRMALMELHTSESDKLKAQFKDDPRSHVHHRDGLEGLIGLVPPEEKRGVVLIDPSYEMKNEYSKVWNSVLKAHQRWAQGTYMIWYPILAEERHRGLITELQRSGVRKIFHSRYMKAQVKEEQTAKAARFSSSGGGSGAKERQASRTGMHGSGLLVINPPWKFGEQCHSVFHSLIKTLFLGDEFVGEWLVPE